MEGARPVEETHVRILSDAFLLGPSALSVRITGVEHSDAGTGDAGEPGRRPFGDECLDVVRVPKPQPELGEQVKAAAAGEEAGSDAVVEQGLAFERSAADAFVAGEHHQAGLPDDRQPCGVGGTGRYGSAGRSGPGDVAADVGERLGDAEAVLVDEPTCGL